jgi:integrase
MSTATVTNKAIRTLTAIRAEDLNDSLKLARMPLRTAAAAWLDTRRPFLGKRTIRDYAKYVDILVRHFGNLPLEKLANPDLLRAYQVERSKTCTATTVNHELGVVVQLLKRIRRWEGVKEHFEPLPMPQESPGRALTPEEEKKLLQAGASRPEWARAYNLTILSINTAAGPSEMVNLRIRDCFVDNPQTARIYIHENVKNKYRVRDVPLNVDALGAVKALLALAREAGAGLPEHYLVPFREQGNGYGGIYDPTRPGLWPKTAFCQMRDAAGVDIRPYDLRHTGLTKLAEKNPEQVVIKIAGHVSPQLLKKVYAHVRLPALREAVDSIGSVSVVRPVTKEQEAKPEHTLYHVAKMAEQLGIEGEKALQLLLEYERQQALRKKATR